MNRLYRFLLIAVITFNIGQAAADPIQDVDNYINALANHVINIVKDEATTKQAKTDQIYILLQENFNLDWMAKFVIGKNYKQLTDQQRSKYETAYSQFFLYSYLPNLMKYNDESFKIIETYEATPGNYTVETKVIRTDGKPPILIDYQVKAKPGAAGQYQVIDVVVEGISAIMSHRSEFASTIQQSGMDGFLKQLEDKTKALQSKSNA